MTAVTLASLIIRKFSDQEITSNRALYPKPTEDLKAITLFGENIVSTENDDWKRHRRIAAPSFNERNNRLVFEETTRIVDELCAFWSKKYANGPVHIDDFVDVTTKLALMIISSAGLECI
jgi:cytochrome P450